MKMSAKKLIIIPGLVLFGTAIVILCFRSNEPTYKGRRLSEWVEDYGREWTRVAGAVETNVIDVQSEEALQHFGTNAVPYLLEWMNFKFPPYWSSTNHFVQFLKNRKFIFEPVAKKKFRADGAMRTFKLLGPRADCAVGELTLRVTNLKSNQDQSAAMALTYLGPKAVPGLIAAITNQQIQTRYIQIAALRDLGTNARPALPALLKAVQDPDPFVAGRSLRSLGNLQLEPEQVIPVMITNLSHTNPQVRYQAATALGHSGRQAQATNALPALLKAMNDSDPAVAAAAALAMRGIQQSAVGKGKGP